MLVTKVHSGGNEDNLLDVDKDGAARVSISPHPPFEDKTVLYPFRAYFRNDAGSNDMRVVGSLASPLFFFIKASPDKDIYIKTLSFEIADASATLNVFGNIGVLANGVEFFWDTQDVGNVIIHEALKTNWDFVRLCGGEPAFGATTTAFRASNVSGTSEGYIPFMDVSKTFGLPWGIKLRAGTNDKLVFKIKDNLSGVDSFNVIAYGSVLNKQ